MTWTCTNVSRHKDVVFGIRRVSDVDMIFSFNTMIVEFWPEYDVKMTSLCYQGWVGWGNWDKETCKQSDADGRTPDRWPETRALCTTAAPRHVTWSLSISVIHFLHWCSEITDHTHIQMLQSILIMVTFIVIIYWVSFICVWFLTSKTCHVTRLTG
jgi:hypothetical protein